jgi:uncharacterized membrane protein YoaK (UPF0700 family)
MASWWNDEQHGPLPAVLLVMTFVTGVVDAVSYLSLGHVFVANMTGNVVFLGFALAGSSDVALAPALIATASFTCGAAAGGRLARVYGSHRGRLLALCALIELALVGAAALAVTAIAAPGGARNLMVLLLAGAMGFQNAVARRVAVPDLTTTVLTLTLTGLASDSWSGGARNRSQLRRTGSLVSMLFGALGGGLLVLRVNVASALAIACVLLAAAGAFVIRASRTSADGWTAAR